jgi:acetyl-CoA carboxylase biotin carboxyl carrier protein
MSKKNNEELTIVRDLSKVLKEQGLTEIEFEKDGLKIRVQNNPSYNVTHNEVVRSNQVIEEKDLIINDNKKYIKSPMVGTCYLSPEPGTPPFVKIGDKINIGDTIIVIEAMKTFNSIAAKESGTIIKILVEDGQPIEFDENLIVIE